MRERRRAILIALVALWVVALVMRFVETTGVFGTRGGVLGWVLLALAALGFILIGALGMWLIFDALGDDARDVERRAGR